MDVLNASVNKSIPIDCVSTTQLPLRDLANIARQRRKKRQELQKIAKAVCEARRAHERDIQHRAFGFSIGSDGKKTVLKCPSTDMFVMPEKRGPVKPFLGREFGEVENPFALSLPLDHPPAVVTRGAAPVLQGRGILLTHLDRDNVQPDGSIPILTEFKHIYDSTFPGAQPLSIQNRLMMAMHVEEKGEQVTFQEKKKNIGTTKTVVHGSGFNYLHVIPDIEHGCFKLDEKYRSLYPNAAPAIPSPFTESAKPVYCSSQDERNKLQAQIYSSYKQVY
jgi:hypothetical protein